MRLEVTIPDQIYGDAKRVAGKTGISFENFLVESLQLHIEDVPDLQEPLLTPEQIATIRQGQAEIKAGNGLTKAQVDELHAARKAACLEINPG